MIHQEKVVLNLHDKVNQKQIFLLKYSFSCIVTDFQQGITLFCMSCSVLIG